MSTNSALRYVLSAPGVVALLMASVVFADRANAADLKVMKTGLGSGRVSSSTPGIECGMDCDQSYTSAVSFTLTAIQDPGSEFAGWSGDCSGTLPCPVTMSADRSVRAEFRTIAPIAPLTDLTPGGIGSYLAAAANAHVNSPARFINALPRVFKQNWILMPRSESLQTGTAQSPRILLPNETSENVFTIGMTEHSSYPGSHPNAIEYMQWDPADNNFRFHEVIVAPIPDMGDVITLPDGSTRPRFPARARGVSVDDAKCSKCHSTRNVLNRSSFPGTDGIPPGTVKVKNKPNWDAYDSWGGMHSFNRDRIYQGSVEAAAFRKIFNPWTWRTNDPIRSVIELLELQPPDVPPAHEITRINGGVNDGHVNFGFDAAPPVLTEPAPAGSLPAPSIAYAFDGVAGTPPGTPVVQGSSFVTLHHSSDPTNDEGRGVRMFDTLGGLAGDLNARRVADELINHRFATGGVPIDVRPTVLAISKRCLVVNAGTVISNPDPVFAPPLPSLAVDLAFFDSRNGMGIDALVTDTRTRAQSLPRRKADIQKIDLNRIGDRYLFSTSPADGLIQSYGATTSEGADISNTRIRQEVFQRPGSEFNSPDQTVMGGVYVDREDYSINTNPVALYRYFLEPLGVSVDKWSMGVRGRSRTYTFADVFSTYGNTFDPMLSASLPGNPISGLSDPNDCRQLIPAVNATLSSLPAADAIPTFTDVQRIFNKNCIECHGDLGYPPYGRRRLDFSEDEAPPTTVPPLVSPRLARSYANAAANTTTDPATSDLYQRITQGGENCPGGIMPCGGPSLSKADTETIRRWIVGKPGGYTEGDPHIRTVDGVAYDFQSAGEFVLLRDENLEIQARQIPVATTAPLAPNSHTGLSSCVSLNGAVAVRVGDHRITYQPNISGRPDPEGLQLRIDGKLTKMSAREILLESGGRIVRTPATGGIQIEAPGGPVIVITPDFWSDYQLWYMNINVRNVRATQGVMGVIARGNWLPALPDGSLLGARPADLRQRYLDLYRKFASAWRVKDATSLFDYAPGTSTRTFTLATWPEESPRSCAIPRQPGGAPPKPPLKPLAPEIAKRHCSAVVDKERKSNCEQDVMVTGHAGFAKTYLQTDEIERNVPPPVPVLDAPVRNMADFARTLTFNWNKSSKPDGTAVTYRLCVWVSGEKPTFKNCDAPSNVAGFDDKTVSKVLSALEPGKDYLWKVIAEDGKGGSTESETRRFTVN